MNPSSSPVDRPDARTTAGAAGAGRYPAGGDFVLGNQASPVAVCTLATQSILIQLQGRPEIAIAGRVYTENVGIEKMVQNLLAAGSLRYLLVCGRESRHRVGQAILSLHRNGVDPLTHRILGATGPEPVVPNLTPDLVAAFQQRISVVDLIGEQDPERILAQARACINAEGGGAPVHAEPVASAAAGPEVIQAEADPSSVWTYDPLGFFLVHLDRYQGVIRLEHYNQDRRLLNRLEGSTARALSDTVVRLGLVSLLGHAAYLGRELARAEAALHLGLEYRQDSPLRSARV